MSSSMLYRLSGGALLTGGLLMIIGLVGALFTLGSTPPDDPTAMNASFLFQLVFLLIVCGLMLITVGLPGMYMRQARSIGIAGLIGFGLTMFGVLLALGLALLTAIVIPWIATAAPKLQYAGPTSLFILLYSAFLLPGIGSLVLGLTMAQANVLPRGVGVLLLLSGLANIVAIAGWPIGVVGFIGQVLFAGALVWAGYALALQQVEAVMSPKPAATKAQS
ncbi:MAG: hypothetical protein NVS2B12_23510 [Ktedonobacteraceae bacterium]